MLLTSTEYRYYNMDSGFPAICMLVELGLMRALILVPTVLAMVVKFPVSGSE